MQDSLYAHNISKEEKKIMLKKKSNLEALVLLCPQVHFDDAF